MNEQGGTATSVLDGGGQADVGDERVMRTVRRLCDRFGTRVKLDELEVLVRAQFARFEDATVHDFVPILVEREVRRELHGHANAG